MYSSGIACLHDLYNKHGAVVRVALAKSEAHIGIVLDLDVTPADRPLAAEMVSAENRK